MSDVGRSFFVVEEASATSRISIFKTFFAVVNLNAVSQDALHLNLENHDLWFLIYLFHNYMMVLYGYFTMTFLPFMMNNPLVGWLTRVPCSVYQTLSCVFWASVALMPEVSVPAI